MQWDKVPRPTYDDYVVAAKRHPAACPNATAFYDSALSIPLFPGMTDADVTRVIDDVRESATGL